MCATPPQCTEHPCTSLSHATLQRVTSRMRFASRSQCAASAPFTPSRGHPMPSDTTRRTGRWSRAPTPSSQKSGRTLVWPPRASPATTARRRAHESANSRRCSSSTMPGAPTLSILDSTLSACHLASPPPEVSRPLEARARQADSPHPAGSRTRLAARRGRARARSSPSAPPPVQSWAGARHGDRVKVGTRHPSDRRRMRCAV